jgi:hypothetical protein
VPGPRRHAARRHPLAHLRQAAGDHVDQLLPRRGRHGAGHLDIAHYITTPKGEIAGSVLLVDDLADSGLTLNKVVEMLRGKYSKVTELRTAVLWTKGLSKFTPDYSSSSCRPIPGSTSPSRATTPCAGEAPGEVEGMSSLKSRRRLFKWPDQCEEDRQSRILLSKSGRAACYSARSTCRCAGRMPP